MCGLEIADLMITMEKNLSGVTKTSTWEITFKQRLDAERKQKFLFAGDVAIPREAFVGGGSGPSFIPNREWIVISHDGDEVPVKDAGIILMHMVLLPGEGLKKMIWIPGSLLASVVEQRKRSYC